MQNQFLYGLKRTNNVQTIINQYSFQTYKQQTTILNDSKTQPKFTFTTSNNGMEFFTPERN